MWAGPNWQWRENRDVVLPSQHLTRSFISTLKRHFPRLCLLSGLPFPRIFRGFSSLGFQIGDTSLGKFCFIPPPPSHSPPLSDPSLSTPSPSSFSSEHKPLYNYSAHFFCVCCELSGSPQQVSPVRAGAVHHGHHHTPGKAQSDSPLESNH